MRNPIRVTANPLALLAASARQVAALERVEHRPWPLPERSWTAAQSWEDLLFAHWPVRIDELRPLVPDGLELDVYDGRAWLALVPFRMSAVRLRGTLPVPVLSTFLELNVRTYVTAGGRPGIWFFSLDASSPLAVEVARRTYRLPYFPARMSQRTRAGWIAYDSSRSGAGAVVLSARYRPAGEAFEAAAGSIEAFLTERYCLYAADRHGALFRADVHHAPWPLQLAEAEIQLNTMAPDGIALPDEAPLLHFARRLDVVVWPLEPVP